METVATKTGGVNRNLPYVKANRLIESNGQMIETKEAKAFPRKAWEKFFDKVGNPILPKFNWKFIESIPSPGNNDELLPEVTGGSEIESVRKKTEANKTAEKTNPIVEKANSNKNKQSHEKPKQENSR